MVEQGMLYSFASIAVFDKKVDILDAWKAEGYLYYCFK